MTQEIHGSIYDYPQYYDILFGADWKDEFRFLQGCFDRYATGKVRRIFEPACGTGRLLIKLAEAGYDVSGNDLNRKAVDYCNARFERHSFKPAAVVGDMADFRLPRQVDACFNLINSFRHLQSETDAENHLRCVAAALRPGGIYALGLHLTPQGRPDCGEERWSAQRGRVTVNSRLWTIARNRRARAERVGMTLDVETPKKRFRLIDEMPFRMYTAAQFQDLLTRVREFELVANYDFMLELDLPITVTSKSEDVIWILRKR